MKTKKEKEKGAAPPHGAADRNGKDLVHGHKSAAGDTEPKKKTTKPAPKWMVWIPVGLVVILLEVGVSYTLVNRFTVPKAKGQEKASQTPSKKDGGTAEKETPKSETKEGRKEKKQDREKPSSETLKGSVEGESEIRIGSFFTLDDLVVNPAFSNGKHYFILSVVLTFNNSSKAELVKEFEPILRDRLLSHLSAKTFYWLSTHTNREVLRREVGEVVGEVLKTPSGLNVYFTKYVLQ